MVDSKHYKYEPLNTNFLIFSISSLLIVLPSDTALYIGFLLLIIRLKPALNITILPVIK